MNLLGMEPLHDGKEISHIPTLISPLPFASAPTSGVQLMLSSFTQAGGIHQLRQERALMLQTWPAIGTRAASNPNPYLQMQQFEQFASIGTIATVAPAVIKSPQEDHKRTFYRHAYARRTEHQNQSAHPSI